MVQGTLFDSYEPEYTPNNTSTRVYEKQKPYAGIHKCKCGEWFVVYVPYNTVYCHCGKRMKLTVELDTQDFNVIKKYL